MTQTQYKQDALFSSEELIWASATVRDDLLSERTSDGHWVGELSSSPLATATAISALVIAHHQDYGGSAMMSAAGKRDFFAGDRLVQSDLSELIVESLHWLARRQNSDGGWGDTDRSLSNIATTMLVRAAFQLTGVPARYANLVERADQFIETHGGVAGLRRRYGKDKTFAAPILMNFALADLIPWRQVPALPFELACLPQSWLGAVQLPVVSYAMPALVAIGQAKFHHDPPRSPLRRMLRQAAVKRSLQLVDQLQPPNGGFLEATPLTSFVVMSLASIGLADHPIVRRGVEFLLASVRGDSSWPIDTNLSTWTTTLSVNALAPAAALGTANRDEPHTDPHTDEILSTTCLDWLLGCQHTQPHPYTGAQPGGWAWTDLPGGVPDADDTAGALIALDNWQRLRPAVRANRVAQAAEAGVSWLLDLQNRDGGWPTFCRGWGALPFDRSATDITAHAMRALHTWRRRWQSTERRSPVNQDIAALIQRIDQALDAGWKFLAKQCRQDGSWVPLWFGNQLHPEDENPVYGTARVLTLYAELGRLNDPVAKRAVGWLVDTQLVSGGWGPATSKADTGASSERRELPLADGGLATVEETSLAVFALLPLANRDPMIRSTVERGLRWLLDAVQQGRHREAAPIGFYFARLWYYERLYPLAFATAALERAVESLAAADEFAGHGLANPVG